MILGSFDFPPADGKAVHQVINNLPCVVVGLRGEMGVSGSGQDGTVAKDSLDFKQVDACLDQMSCVAMA